MFSSLNIILISLMLFIDFVIPAIMNIYNVPTHSYINYIIFINACYIFYLILPSKINSLS